MGNHDERAGIGPQEILQPFHGRDVQMVCRFVQEQKVGATEQHFGELKLRLLAAAQHADRHPHLRVIKPQPQKGGTRPRPAGEPAQPDELVVEERLALDQRVGGMRLQCQVDFLQFLLHCEQVGKDGEHLAVGAAFQIAADVLFHISQHSGIGLIDIAAVSVEFPVKILKRVVFPEPLTPTKPTRSFS